jgi:hypothetical protein
MLPGHPLLTDASAALAVAAQRRAAGTGTALSRPRHAEIPLTYGF